MKTSFLEIEEDESCAYTWWQARAVKNIAIAAVLMLAELSAATAQVPDHAPGKVSDYDSGLASIKVAQQFYEQGKFEEAGFKVDTAVEVGDIREGIIDSAAEWGADLIVIGSLGRSGIQRFLLGSVADSSLAMPSAL